VAMEVRNIAQGRAMSSLRAARITNIRQRPLLVTTLMLLSIARVCVCVCVCARVRARVCSECAEKGTKRFLVGRRSNTEVVKEPRNFVELRIASLSADDEDI